MALYLNDHFKLGRRLDLSIDIGLAMTAKIIKKKVRSNIGPLTEL